MRRVVSGTGPNFGREVPATWEFQYLAGIKEVAQESPLLVDVAPTYASGAAERLLGACLGQDSNIEFMTKLRIHQDGGPSADAVFEASLSALKREYVDYLCTHWSGGSDEFRRDLDFLLSAKQEGRARFIGLGNPSLEDLEIARSEGVLLEISFVQAEYSLSDTSIATALKQSHLETLKIFGYSPLSEGRIAPSKRARELIDSISTLYQVSPSELVLAYLMKHPLVYPITISRNQSRHLKNLSAEFLDLDSEVLVELVEMEKSLTRDVHLGDIVVSRDFASARGYTTLEEARSNAAGLSPSPVELAEDFKNGYAPLKPLKVAPDPASPGKYLLAQGQLRYWALVLAFGFSHSIRVVVMD